MEKCSLTLLESSNDFYSNIYRGDCTAEQSYMLVKDFHFNLCKTLQRVIDRILSSQQYKGKVFELFDRFMEFEYALLNEGKSTERAAREAKIGIKEALMQANMVDSEEFRAKRKTSYGKLCALVELLSKASQLNKLSPEHTEKLIAHMTSLLNTSESSL